MGLRIAIVNDLPMAVEVLRRVVVSVPEYSIAWIARDGAEAAGRCRQDRPDLILMDLIMPVMDGVQATAAIMKEATCAILVVTATVSGNAALVFEAMGYGALDAAGTPVLGPGGDLAGGAELLKKIEIIGKLIGDPPPEPPARFQGKPERRVSALPLVALGASTGGPKALETVLAGLPARLGAAVVVIQHVDSRYAEGLAGWLASRTHLPVHLAREGDRPAADTVYVAGTGDHLIIAPDGAFHYTPEPRQNPFRPSVDRFFLSLAEGRGNKSVAVLLTGMGRDGAKGLLALRQAGWHTIAQDENTSVIYGMPRMAAELKAAVEILPLEQIAPAIVRKLTNKDEYHGIV